MISRKSPCARITGAEDVSTGAGRTTLAAADGDGARVQLPANKPNAITARHFDENRLIRDSRAGRLPRNGFRCCRDRRIHSACSRSRSTHLPPSRVRRRSMHRPDRRMPPRQLPRRPTRRLRPEPLCPDRRTGNPPPPSTAPHSRQSSLSSSGYAFHRQAAARTPAVNQHERSTVDCRFCSRQKEKPAPGEDRAGS